MVGSMNVTSETSEWYVEQRDLTDAIPIKGGPEHIFVTAVFDVATGLVVATELGENPSVSVSRALTEAVERPATTAGGPPRVIGCERKLAATVRLNLATVGRDVEFRVCPPRDTREFWEGLFDRMAVRSPKTNMRSMTAFHGEVLWDRLPRGCAMNLGCVTWGNLAVIRQNAQWHRGLFPDDLFPPDEEVPAFIIGCSATAAKRLCRTISDLEPRAIAPVPYEDSTVYVLLSQRELWGMARIPTDERANQLFELRSENTSNFHVLIVSNINEADERKSIVGLFEWGAEVHRGEGWI